MPKYSDPLLPVKGSQQLRRTSGNYNCRTCANGSKMIMGKDNHTSYAPVACHSSIWMQLNAAPAGVWIAFIFDISNTFQNTCINEPFDQVYLVLSIDNINCFCRKSPKQPIVKQDVHELVIQCLKSIQGTNNADHPRYQLLCGIFKQLGIHPSTKDHGDFTWIKDNHWGIALV